MGSEQLTVVVDENIQRRTGPGVDLEQHPMVAVHEEVGAVEADQTCLANDMGKRRGDLACDAPPESLPA